MLPHVRRVFCPLPSSIRLTPFEVLNFERKNDAAVSHLVKLSLPLFKSWLYLNHGEILLNELLLHSRGIKETYAVMKCETLYTTLFISETNILSPLPTPLKKKQKQKNFRDSLTF